MTSQFSRSVRYSCRLWAAVVILGSEEAIVKSSAYEDNDTLGFGVLVGRGGAD